MNKIKTIVIIAMCSFSCSALTENQSSVPIPVASENDLIYCFSLYKIAASAIDYKAQGKTKAEMLARLPLRSVIEASPGLNGKKLVALSMHDIISDIYDHETLPMSVYAPYASEKCYRRGTNKTNVEYAKVRPKLLACSKLAESKHVECAIKSANGR